MVLLPIYIFYFYEICRWSSHCCSFPCQFSHISIYDKTNITYKGTFKYFCIQKETNSAIMNRCISVYKNITASQSRIWKTTVTANNIRKEKNFQTFCSIMHAHVLDWIPSIDGQVIVNALPFLVTQYWQVPIHWNDMVWLTENTENKIHTYWNK